MHNFTCLHLHLGGGDHVGIHFSLAIARVGPYQDIFHANNGMPIENKSHIKSKGALRMGPHVKK